MRNKFETAFTDPKIHHGRMPRSNVQALKTPDIMSRPVSVSYHTNMGIRTALFTLNRPLEEGLARLARGHSVVETWEEENGSRLLI